MNSFKTDLSFAQALDDRDELAGFRNEFVIDEPNLIYLDGNSLGRLPKHTVEAVDHAVRYGWGSRLIRVWNDGWIDAPTEIGAKIAGLVGAQADEILVTEATSINLFKLAVAALRARPDRAKIVSDVFNFPSDLYIIQGVIDLLGRHHRLELIPSGDTVTIDPAAVSAAIDNNTALVSLSHVAFKSAFLYDMAEVTHRAHQAGALTLWDLSHSVGAVPVDLNGSGADLAVGCTYKYLNGGPGAPAFLYVRRELQSQLSQPLWGWFAAKDPFAFELDYVPAPDISRYRVGTPPMLSLQAVEPGVDLLLEAGLDRVRAKSMLQTDYLIYLTDRWLVPLGFTLGSPRQADIRGSHVSIRHPDGYRINRAMIESEAPAVKVIPDFRTPDNIRLGLAPLYTSFTEIYQAIDRIRIIVAEGLHEKYPIERLAVT